MKCFIYKCILSNREIGILEKMDNNISNTFAKFLILNTLSQITGVQEEVHHLIVLKFYKHISDAIDHLFRTIHVGIWEKCVFRPYLMYVIKKQNICHTKTVIIQTTNRLKYVVYKTLLYSLRVR